MKTILVALFLIFSFFNHANSCTIETYAQIIKVNSHLDDKVIKSSNCDPMIEKEFISLVEGAQGSINSDHLSKVIKNQSGLKPELTILPKRLEIKDIKDVLQEKLALEGLVIDKVTSLYSQASINIEKKSNLKVQCRSCTQTGTKSILLKNDNENIWLTAKIFKTRFAYKLIKPISSLNQQLDKSFFKRVKVQDLGIQALFSDIENINFYRPIRYLHQGDIIKAQDLTSKNLIRFGDTVKVNLRGKNINLKYDAVAKSSGKIGDFITIENRKTKKQIQAKVVDFKKVVVEI